MRKVTITVEDFLYEFYTKIGEAAGGIKPEDGAKMRLARRALLVVYWGYYHLRRRL